MDDYFFDFVVSKMSLEQGQCYTELQNYKTTQIRIIKRESITFQNEYSSKQEFEDHSCKVLTITYNKIVILSVLAGWISRRLTFKLHESN